MSNRRKLAVNDYVIDNTAGGSVINGQTTKRAVRVYFEIQSAGSCFVGINLAIELKTQDEFLPIGYEFSNEGFMNYHPIKYQVPIGCKLLVVEEHEVTQMQ